MAMRIDGQNGKRSQTTNLKQHKKTHKKFEAGQTLAQPTGDPKLREKFNSQPQVVTNKPVQSFADDMALLNQQATLAEQNEKIEKTKRQIASEEKKLAQMNRAENPEKYDEKVKRIKSKKADLAKLYDNRAGIETKIQKTQNEILKAHEPVPAGDPIAARKAQLDKVWKEKVAPSLEKELKPAAQNSLTRAIMPNQKTTGKNLINEFVKPVDLGIYPDKDGKIYSELTSTGKSGIYPIADGKVYGSQLSQNNFNLKTKISTPVKTVPLETIEIPEIAETGKKSHVGPQTIAHEATDFERLILEPVSTEPAAATQSAASGATPGLKSEAETAAKESKGIWGSIKNAFKGKKGKAAIAVGAAALVGAGLYAVFGGNDDKKAEEVKPEVQQEENPVTPAPTDSTDVEIVEESDVSGNPEEKAATTDENKVTPVPVGVPEKADTTKVAEKNSAKTGEANNVVAIPAEEKAKEAQEEKEIAEADKADEAQAASKTEKSDKADKTEQVTEQEIKEYVAKDADNYWKYAKRELIAEHQGDANYKPTDKEVYDRMIKIMERNGVAFAKDGIHTNPMLKIGDKVKVAFDDVAA